VFGSLFTLLLPLYLWVRPRWRALLIVGGAHLGILVWILTYPFDRYLHAVVPWMAACVAAALAAAWRMGPAVLRLGVVLLVAFQMIWGGDIYLLLTHWRMAELPLHPMDEANRSRHFVRNPYPGQELTPIGARLPKNSRPIAHDFYQTVGVGVMTISDNPYWQGTIDYLQIEPPQKVLSAWRRLGATHLLWPYQKEPRSAEDLARDAVFARASVAFTDSSFTVAGYRVAELIDRRAPRGMRDPTRIAWLACDGQATLGVYTPAGLAQGKLEKPLVRAELQQDPVSVLADINAVWLRESCEDTKAAYAVVSADFTEVMRSGDLGVWIRRPHRRSR
jgi:hypothetical protein